MANITLREYLREIEALIEQGQTDEAIGHCRHLLKFFPKHIETYRLLGKAFLESKRYGDAADIFQRLLSSIPDDFVAHIGMSMIREDEGNLDASIWHMERAYDVQPSNVAIQDELRRLYGRKEGVEPPRIRLTRGALARMYSHGHLYAQAVGELRAALALEPKRMDLQVLLAKMYHLNKQQVNAAKTSSQLLNKLPYCYEANIILGQILTETDRQEEAQTYIQRAQELEPYRAYLTPQIQTVDAVQAGAIVLDKLEWDQSQARYASQPSWATSLGVDMAEQPELEKNIPDWLTPTGQAGIEEPPSDEMAALTSPFTDSELGLKKITDLEPENLSTEEANMEEENIPDWMKDAGWDPKDPNTPEEPDSDSDIFDKPDDDSEEDLEKAEIPDWLQAMAPSEVDGDEEKDELEATPATDLPDWLQGSGDLDSTESSPPSEGDDSAVPGWLEEIVSDSGPTGAGDVPAPEWLQETVGEEGLEKPASQPPEEEPVPADEMEVPGWLKELSEEETLIPTALADEDVPEWLKEFGDDQGEAAEEAVPAELEAEQEFPAPIELQEEAPQAVSEDETALPDWLDTSEEEALPAGLDEITSPAASDQEEIPVWLEEFAGEAADEIETPEEPVSAALLDAQAPETVLEEAAESAEVPDWLEGLEDEFPSAHGLKDVKMEMEEADQVEPVQEPLAADETAPPAPLADQVQFPETADEDESMAWLENLAAHQGADEEELLTEPEERVETPPEWLQDILDEAPETAPPEMAETESPPPDEEPAPEVDSMEAPSPEPGLESVEPETEPPVSPAEEVSEMNEDAALAWLESLAAKQGVEEEELLTSPEERVETPPEWLENILEESPAETEVTPKGEAEIEIPPEEEVVLETPEPELEPETLASLEDTAVPLEQVLDDAVDELEPAETPTELEAEPQMDMGEDEAMAWLESLAAKQGVEEEELLTEPDQRSESPPEWLQGMIEESTPTPETVETATEEILPEVEPGPEIGEDEAPISDIGPLEEEGIEVIAEAETPLQEEESPDWLTDSAAQFIAQSEDFEEDLETVGEEPVEMEEAEEMPVLEDLEELAGEQPGAQPEEIALEPAEVILQAEAPVEEAVTAEVDSAAVMQEEVPEVEAEPGLEPLHQARNLLEEGQLDSALEQYDHLIEKKQSLEEVIKDLKEALKFRYPVDIRVWQTLGDAYVRNNQLQDALDSYTKAEELLR